VIAQQHLHQGAGQCQQGAGHEGAGRAWPAQFQQDLSGQFIARAGQYGQQGAEVRCHTAGQQAVNQAGHANQDEYRKQQHTAHHWVPLISIPPDTA